MKKPFQLFMSLLILSLIITGCQDSSIKKIENTTQIIIGYGTRSFAAIITDQEEITQLENKFNKAKFTKTDTPLEHPFLLINFQNKKGSSSAFLIDEKDVIRLEDGSYMKSEQISFSQLHSIYKKYHSK